MKFSASRRGNHSPLFFFFFLSTSIYIYILFVLVFAFRYMAICHDPLRCQPMSSCAVQRHIVIIWGLAIATMLPTIVYQNQYINEHYGVPMCGLTFPSQWVEQVFFCLVVLLCYVLPLLFILLSYCFIFHTVSNRHMIGEETTPRLTETSGIARAKVSLTVTISRGFLIDTN